MMGFRAICCDLQSYLLGANNSLAPDWRVASSFSGRLWSSVYKSSFVLKIQSQLLSGYFLEWSTIQARMSGQTAWWAFSAHHLEPTVSGVHEEMRKKPVGYKATGVSPLLDNVEFYTVAPLSETEWETNSCPEEEWGNPSPPRAFSFWLLPLLCRPWQLNLLFRWNELVPMVYALLDV